MVSNPFLHDLLPAVSAGGFKMEGYYIWCGSVIKGEDGRYHMFASRWKKDLGFHPHWLFNCEIVRASSDTPEGPYQFEEVVLKRRERQYFDGLNQHNPHIRYWNGTYYLYYMGTTYGGAIPEAEEYIPEGRSAEVWNNKRIGLATSTSIFGPWKRRDTPLLNPRAPGYWDCTATTNPTVAIQEDGTTYMIYKSRACFAGTLKLGVTRASSPEGPFLRLKEDPILQFEDPDLHVEDPYLWYDNGLFHLLIKDDFKNDSTGLTGEWGAGVYATSRNCIDWEIHDDPKAYSREIIWDDGTRSVQCNLERPFLLIEDGVPTHLFLATGTGNEPWSFDDTWNMVIPLKREWEV